jgi:ABC-type branched-subunit amino acid transport system substrate-binding protein
VAEARGAEVVFAEASYPSTGVADYSTFVADLVGAEPDVILLFIDFANDAGMNGALRDAGFEGAVVNYDTYVPGILDAQPDLAASLEGAYIVTQVPPVEGDSAAVDQIRADLAAIGAEDALGLGAIVGWFSADLALAALAQAAPATTGAEFDAAVNGAGFVYASGPDAIGDVAFPAAHDDPNPCAALVHVVDGAYTQALPMTCYEVLGG